MSIYCVILISAYRSEIANIIERVHLHDDIIKCPKCKVLDVLSLGRCVPWMMSHLDDTALGCHVLWMMHPLDKAFLRHGVPDQCVLALDCIEILVMTSHLGLS
jgi:hypothetical protein